MKKYLKLLLLSGIVPLIFSCGEDERAIVETKEKDKLTSVRDFLDFLNIETTGGVLFQSLASPYTDHTYQVSSTMEGNGEPLAFLFDGKQINPLEYRYDKKSNRSYTDTKSINVKDLYGKHFSVASFPKNQKKMYLRSINDGAAEDKFEKIYIPEVIYTTFDNLKNEKVAEGTTITWNADTENEKGVFLGIEYSPYSQSKKEIIQDSPERLLKGFNLPDKGTYTITKEDLADFPDNASITFYVGRAGYNVVLDKDTGKDYSIAGISVFTADFQVDK